ncbi:hypothetical protein CEXT_179581 [Caerostris extrusa]|uniref:Uncharacterized protein n=1 Tax=Caerostris extrusa TaxID=172846 RepID=A0AAV4PB46_CAEEX|nr:hypothetical protein CEXT_179581 [Caerostris extrusa]
MGNIFLQTIFPREDSLSLLVNTGSPIRCCCGRNKRRHKKLSTYLETNSRRLREVAEEELSGRWRGRRNNRDPSRPIPCNTQQKVTDYGKTAIIHDRLQKSAEYSSRCRFERSADTMDHIVRRPSTE